MSFLGRVLGGGGAAMRRAVELEAGGDYAEAARAYAAAGARSKVAEMHLMSSERASGPDGKLDALREAARWADDDDDAARKVRRRIAASLLAWARARGIITEGDRGVVAEAAALFVSAGDSAGAGACHELLGSAEAAAVAYQSAGEVDQLERLLDGEADKRRRSVAVADAIEEHRYRLRNGDPGRALAALEDALSSAEPRERPALQQMRDELMARRLAPGRLVLASPGSRIVVAAPPLLLGRGEDAQLTLKDGGVSRRHVELHLSGRAWQITDLGSKNGTTLSGVPLAGTLPLPAAGELGVGDRCTLALSVAGAQLSLEITRGLEQGLRLYSGDGTIAIARARGGDALCLVRFVDGRAQVRKAEAALYLNGSAVSAEAEPLAGDVLESGGTRWEVSA